MSTSGQTMLLVLWRSARRKPTCVDDLAFRVHVIEGKEELPQSGPQLVPGQSVGRVAQELLFEALQ